MLREELPSANREGKGGALVLSLDFELQWGFEDHQSPNWPYRRNILGARLVVPKILDVFEDFSVSATWATVGCLFAESRDELMHFAPVLRPSIRNRCAGASTTSIGKSEADDPLHFAPSLIAEIRSRRRQEIGCHTFSHFYCHEPGATSATFREDIQSAVLLARERGVGLTSLVFPRNQVTTQALALLPNLGFKAYRGGELGWMYDTRPGSRNQPHRKAGRFIDQHLAPASRLVDWSVLSPNFGLSNVRGSFFLRSFHPTGGQLNRFRLRRLVKAMRAAAMTRKILHLWWHPHNFGANVESSLDALRHLLDAFAECRERFGLESLTMAEAASLAGESYSSTGVLSSLSNPVFSSPR